MKKICFVSCFNFLCFSAFCQNKLIALIKNDSAKTTISGVTVQIKNLRLTAVANDSGVVSLADIPNGKHLIEFTHVGYKDVERTFLFPLETNDTLQIFMEPSSEELEEVTVSSTRSNRSINNTPTRVEIISDEEIHEEAEMRPGDIRMLLAESTGIQTQQTSATSANASIRIQGLDGRYTLILKDGFPIYSGAASGLGLLQTPPLDLRQVEIIKGSASTLYGGGAIAGLINLITKVPSDKREMNIHFNITSAGGLDINSFYSERFKKTGLTFYISRNTNKPFDPAHIFFTAIPKFERYTINPKVFFYFSNKTKLDFGINTTWEDRTGGDINVIKGKGDVIHSYFEKNVVQRVSTQLTLDHQVDEDHGVKIKNSVSYFKRKISSPGYIFDANQYSTFSEATYVAKLKKTDWVVGLNILTDNFKETFLSSTPLRNYTQTTVGAFAQNTCNVSPLLTLETGIRGDDVINYGFILLPKISLLFKITPKLTSRIGGGLGYKTPTIFSEESEKLLYRNVLAINSQTNKLERSYGANWDVNFHTSFDQIRFSLNQFFFFTYLKDPLLLESISNGFYRFQNSLGHIITKGAETNVKLAYDGVSLYLGYTFTDSKVHDKGSAFQNPLSPKHRFNAALVYEIEHKWKFGSELYYFSKQKLSDGNTGRGYWLTGLVAERIWKSFSLYVNFENFGDVRQTKFESIYTGTVTNPVFKDIYASLEGFVVNGGFRIKF